MLALAFLQVVAALAVPAPPVPVIEVTAAVDVAVAEVLARDALAQWALLDGLWTTTKTTTPSSTSPRRIVVRSAFSLPVQQLARSTPGTIELRLGPPAVVGATVDDATRTALRHEVVHQYLWQRCPQAARDRLFHEAMAVALSGEARQWRTDGYLSLPVAMDTLAHNDLDTAAARRALTRVVGEGGQFDPGQPSSSSSSLSSSLRARFGRCHDGAPWVPLTLEELAGTDAIAVGDALVVLHTVTGEVLEVQGSSGTAMPFGSTLKPILVAAIVAAGQRLPLITRRGTDPMWACGDGASSTMAAAEALRRSCNGWFLDWVSQRRVEVDTGPGGPALGTWGPVLSRLGLNRLPVDMSEAIGVRTGLTISPRGLAESWRLLMLSTPPRGALDVRAVLRERGTLAGVDHVDGLAGMSAKTGTVRDGQSRPVLGLLVAADDELTIVRVRQGAQARALVDDVVAARRRHAGRHQQPVSVQVFGLVPEVGIAASCAGTAVIVGAAPKLLSSSSSSSSSSALASVGADDGVAVCAGAPWMVQPTATSADRPYAGLFRRRPIRPSSSSSLSSSSSSSTAPSASPRQRAARRGSDLQFTTSRGRYAEGVLRAEDSRLRGEARVALVRVIDHNVDHADERHGGRPVCDTTHCQTFLGTASGPAADVTEALASPLRGASLSGWLPFSQGGQAPWTAERSTARVRAAIGAFGSIAVNGSVVVVVRSTSSRDAVYDEAETMPCERLRSSLQLPSCPTRIDTHDDRVVFVGVGAGHGLGLNVERARTLSAAGASADAILDDAWPR